LFSSTALGGGFGYFGGVIEVANPNPAAAAVSLTNVGTFSYPQTLSQDTVSIPAGSWAIFDGFARAAFQVNSNLPVRVVAIDFSGPGLAQFGFGMAAPYDVNATSPPVMTPSSLAFAWQKGSSPLPAARTVPVVPASLRIGRVTAATASGQSWLSVSVTANSSPNFALSVSVNPSQLTAGTYQGSIVVKESFGLAATLPVTLTVSDTALPVISATPTSLNFSTPAFNATPPAQTISVTSDSGPAAFSVTLQPGTWLKVSPMSGTAPATLIVTSDPAATSQIYYQQRSTAGSILISGQGNAIAVPATFNVTGVQTFQTFLGESGSGPNGLAFSAQTGSPSQTQTINVDPAGTITAAVDQPWMSAVARTTGMGANQMVTVTVDPAGLGDGVYRGTVTVGEAGLASKAVPVTLGVWSTGPPLTITPGSFTFVQTVGEPWPAPQTAVVDSGGMPVPLTILQGADWLFVVDRNMAPTPTPIQVAVSGPGSPGQYDGSFTLQSPGRSIYVPVTLLVEPGPAATPVLSQVVNAASGMAGGVSPGEILTIRGYGAGAAAVSGLKLDEAGMVAAKLNGLQVTFDGRAAPLIYTSANQTNLIVPYEVAGKTSTVIQVVYTAPSGTLGTAAWVMPVVASAPGVFTMDATGTGPGAIVNQDGTVNSAANPAARGSVISIYATGEGQTSPAGVTGSVTQSNAKAPVLPVTVTIGGTGATVQYAGPAPGAVAGLLQVNAVVPQGIGPALPVTVSAGGIASQAGVTVAVK
jgi:uncharacterized protein (TIGR03437 family)